MSSSEWKEVKLGDILEISSSKRIYAKEYVGSGIPFYRSKEVIEKSKGNCISTELFITKERFNEIREKFGVPMYGDILLTSVGTLGIPYVVRNEEFYFKDGNLTWFKNFGDRCHNKFIYYWLISEYGKNQISAKCIGSTQKALTIDTLKKFDIRIPSLARQKSIAHILSILDEKIVVNSQINKTLENMVQTIFKQWFVDFEFLNEDGEPYKSSGGDMVESELGLIPKGWEVKPLENIIKLHDSKRIPLSKNERMKREKVYPYYGATSLMDYVDDYLFDGIYVLLGEDGTVINDDGTPILQYIWGKFWVNNHAHVVTGKGSLSINFVYMLLKNINVSSAVTGAVQLKINQKNLLGLKVVLPANLKIINRFSELIDKSFEMIRCLSDENLRLESLRDTLLPKLMSGEIRVPIEKS